MQVINGWHILDSEKDTPIIESAQRAPNDANYDDWHNNFVGDIVELYAPDMQKRVALDIGGCVGMMAVPLAQHYKGVFTFEINPTVRNCLNLNTKPYKNITVFGFGMSNHNGVTKFHQSEISGHSRITNDGEILLPVRTLDSFMFDNIDLIKLDVEGHEYQTLVGAVETLKRCKPLVITEIHSQRTRSSYEYRQKIFDLMDELGYRLIDVRRNDYIWR